MLLKKIFYIIFSTFACQSLERYGFGGIVKDTLLRHYNLHSKGCERCLSECEHVSSRIQHFLEEKGSKAKVIPENTVHLDSNSEMTNSVEIWLVDYIADSNKNIVSGFRDFRGEFLLYQNATSALYQIRASLRVYDEVTISVISKNQIAFDYKVYEDESTIERHHNQETTFVISPKIDGFLLLIVAIPTKDPLWEVVTGLEVFKGYKYFFKRKNAVYILSTKKKLLNEIDEKQVYEIIKEKYGSFEEFLDLIDCHVKNKRMCFCFESVPSPVHTESTMSNGHNRLLPSQHSIETEENNGESESYNKPLFKLPADHLLTEYKTGGVVLFRVIEYDDHQRFEYSPSFIKGLDEKIIRVKETQLKGFEAVKNHIFLGYKKILEGECDFENSIEGFILDDGENLVKLRYSTFVCLQEKSIIDSFTSYALLTQPVFSNLLRNMKVYDGLRRQAKKIRKQENKFLSLFEVIKKHSPNVCVSGESLYNIMVLKLNEESKILILSISHALSTTNELLFSIFYDFLYVNNKMSTDDHKLTFEDFLKHYFAQKYDPTQETAKQN